MASLIPFVQKDVGDRVAFFQPALWRQRREHIIDILKNFKATSVIDYGCGEGSVISLLIPCNDEPPITRLAGLDILPESLTQCEERCRPWNTDFENLRERPLTVELFQGSVDSPSRQLQGFDVLVSSEVIEHLNPETLEKYPWVIFGVYRPPVVIISTPNAEFNVLFPQLNYLKPNSKFRDPDHKFEWTREEFQNWCQINCERYRYNVDYSGVGSTPEVKDRHLGYCTQFAVFTRNSLRISPQTVEFKDHKMFKFFEFPCFRQEVSDSDRFESILKYSEYMNSTTSSTSGEWPVYSIKDFWNLLKVRQHHCTPQNFLNFLSSPERNGGKILLKGENHFVILQHPKKTFSAFDKWVKK